jgi:SulP family sulfate permease
MKIKLKLPIDLTPKLFTILGEGYSKQTFIADLISGVLIGIIALPLAIAFGIASGVKPEQGLFSAIVAGIIVSLFSGSRAQVSGPTGAFIVIIYGIVQEYGYDGLAIATILAGIFLVILGLFRFGILLRFIPYSLTIGFTSGIAIIIFSSQVNDFLGLNIQNVPADFIDKWIVYFQNFNSFNFYTIIVGVLSLTLIFVWQRFNLKIPGSLVALIAATLAVQLFNLPVDTIGTKFGSVPNSLPPPSFPHLSWAVITKMFSPAFTIAILAAIESLLSAVVADGMIGTRHRSNMELVAQGLGNIVSPIFSGIPVTGAIARTAANIKNGGKTPIVGIIHSIVLVVIILFFGSYAEMIPLPALSAILIYIAYKMGEWHSFFKTLKAPISDRVILINTFLLTVFIDLTVAIEVGLVLAALSFIKKMSDVTEARLLTESIRAAEEGDETSQIANREIPKGVEIFEVYGTLFFGAVDQFRETIKQLEKTPKVIILQTQHLLVIDGSGIKALEDLFNQLQKEKTVLLVSGLHKQPMFELIRSGLFDRIKEQNFFGNLDEALQAARTLISNKD